MIRRLIIRPEAEADLMAAALWYENRQSGLGEEFLAEARAAINGAVTHPRHYLCLRRRPKCAASYSPDFHTAYFLFSGQMR
jgi:hypothetical protein